MRKRWLALVVACCSAMANAQGFPAHAVTLVVPYTPATGADVIARMLQPRLAERLKQPVVVENRAGASGIIGTDFVAKAPADGHTLLFTATSHGTVPALRRSLPFDAAKGFAPVALAATSAMAFVVGPQVRATKVADFVALAKAAPGKMNYSSPGTGGIQHLAMELLKQDLGIDIVHVPYKGSAGAATDLVGGQVQATIAALQTMAPFVNTGRLRMLAVMSAERSPAFPDVPTLKELGHPDLVVDTWYGVFAPAGTPAPVIAKLNAEINALLAEADVKEALGKQGMSVVTDTPERLGRLLDAELARWRRVVDTAHIQGD